MTQLPVSVEHYVLVEGEEGVAVATDALVAIHQPFAVVPPALPGQSWTIYTNDRGRVRLRDPDVLGTEEEDGG